MKTDLETAGEIINRAFNHASKRGYIAPLLEREILVRHRAAGVSSSMRTWAVGLLFDHDFAKGLFGTHEVDDNGWSISAIKVWAKQVAVEIEGTLRAVPDNWSRPEISYAVIPEIDIQRYSEEAPMELVEAQTVTRELVRMGASIPFETHSIDRVEIYGTRPAYQYHLQQMALSPNPLTYVKEYLDSHE